MKTPLAGANEKIPNYYLLSEEERKYVDLLDSLPIYSILDGGEGEKRCRAIGQEIFDKFKHRDSNKGKAAVQKIYNAVWSRGSGFVIKAECIRDAWSGIGDSDWHWKS